MPSPRQILNSGLLIAVALTVPQSALAADSDPVKKAPRHTVSNYDAFTAGQGRKESSLSTMQSEMHLRVSDVNRAIKMGRRAVELDPDDIDARVALGEALYQKVTGSKKEDPATFNECVKTWLTIHRNVVGFEKGMNFKGVGIPGLQKFYEDEDHGILAKERLTALCGRTPKMFETNKKYLDRVLQAETSVSGQIVKRSSGATSDEKKY